MGLLVVLAIVAAACGTSDGGGPDATSEGSTSPTPEPGLEPTPAPTTSPTAGPADPSVEPTTRGDALRVTGTVRRSPEDRVTVLEAPAQAGRQATTWVLVGAVAGLDDGDRVTVTGRPDPGAVTTAQRGPVLVVESAAP